MLTPTLEPWLAQAFGALRAEAPSGLPPEEPEEAPLGVPEAAPDVGGGPDRAPEREGVPERGPDAMPGVPTEGDPPDAG